MIWHGFLSGQVSIDFGLRNVHGKLQWLDQGCDYTPEKPANFGVPCYFSGGVKQFEICKALRHETLNLSHLLSTTHHHPMWEGPWDNHGPSAPRRAGAYAPMHTYPTIHLRPMRL